MKKELKTILDKLNTFLKNPIKTEKQAVKHINYIVETHGSEYLYDLEKDLMEELD